MVMRDITGFIQGTVLNDLATANRLSEDIEQELLFHIAERKERLVATGMSEAEAEHEARRLFGDFFVARDQCLKSYRLGSRLAFQRFALIAMLIFVTTIVTLFVSERIRPVTSIDDRLNALFADLESTSESRRRSAVVDALVLAKASDLNSLREEIYSRVIAMPVPEVVKHLKVVVMSADLDSELRLSAIRSLGKMSAEDPSVSTFLFKAAKSQNNPTICNAMLDQATEHLDLSAIQSMVCATGVSDAAKIWGLFEIRARCGKDFAASKTWLADSRVLDTATSLILATESIDQQVAIVKLFRESKSPQVRDWLLGWLDQPISRGCLVHVIFDLGQYVDDATVAERLVVFAENADIDVQNHVKRSLALRTR